MKLFHFIEKANLFLVLTCVPLAIYWRVDDPNIVKQLLFDILILLWWIGYSIKTIKLNKFFINQNHLNYSAILFLLFAGFFFLSSKYPTIGTVRFLWFARFIIFLFLISQLIKNQKTAKIVLEMVTFGASIVSCFGILQIFGLDFFLFQRNLSRISATLGHPNFLAGYLVCTLPLTAGLFLSCRKPRKKYLYALYIVIQSACLFFTLSRAAWASVIVSFVFFGAIYLKYRDIHLSFYFTKKKAIFAFLLIGISVTALPSVIKRIPESEIARLTSLGSPSTQNTVWIRWLEWKGALQVIKNAPIMGNGLGTFSMLFPSNQPPEFSSVCVKRDEFLRHAHNEYLEIWSEMGILGLGAFLYMLIAAIISGTRLIKFNKNDPSFFWLLGLISGLIGVSFHMLFSVSFRFIVVPLIFWSYLGVINGLIHVRIGKRTVWELNGAKRLIFILVSLFLTMFLVFSVTRTFSHFAAERYFYEGLANYKAGRLQEALNGMQLALDNCKTKPEIYYKKGVLETKLGMWAEALETYEALEKVHPDFCHTNFNLSLCYLHLKDLSNSIRSGEKEVQLYPDFVEQYYVLGKAYYLNNSYDEAEAYFDKYLQQNPKSVSAHSYLGNISAFRRDWENAILHYKEILNMDPHNSQARLNISQIYLDMGYDE